MTSRPSEVTTLPPRQRFPAIVAWAREHGHLALEATPEPQLGHVGRDVPLEVLDAAGVRPVQIVGDPAADPQVGRRYVGVGTEPRSQSQFTRLVDGTYAHLRAVLFSHDSTTTLRLYYALRAYQMATGEPSAALHVVEVLHLPTASSAEYSRRSVRDLVEQVSAWAGRRLTARDLADAAARRDRIRALLGELAAFRRTDPPRLSGTQMLAVVAAGRSATAGEYEALLAALLEASDELPELPGVRVVVTGSELDDLSLYEVVEGCGAVVVGEDHDGGDLAWEGPPAAGPEPVDALVSRLRDRPSAGPRASASERISHLRALLGRTRADAIVGYVRQGDDGPAWDLARARHVLGEQDGVPVLALTGRGYRREAGTELEAEVRAFLDGVRSGAPVDLARGGGDG